MKSRSGSRYSFAVAVALAACCLGSAVLAMDDEPTSSPSESSRRRANVLEAATDTDEATNAPSSPASIVGNNRQLLPPGKLPGSAEPRHSDVRPASFKDITPGETTAQELTERWGEPLEEQVDGERRLRTYRFGPFPKLEVVLVGDVVESVVVYFAAPVAASELEQELNLEQFTPAVIDDEIGDPLGQAYPERGVVFGFAEDEQPLKVGHLVLERISSEPFLLRVKHDNQRHYELYLADLDYVLQHEPDNAEAYWLKSKVLSEAARFPDALEAAEKAVELSEDDPRFRLARAAALFAVDRHGEAKTDVLSVIEDERAFELTRGRAQCLLGDFLAKGPEQAHNDAARRYQAAIDLAAPFANDPQASTRREAKRILVDAYFAMAAAVARGEWSKKQETMQLWLKGGSQLAAAMMENDGGHPDLRLHAIHRTLAAYAGLQANADANPAVQQLTETVEKLLAGSPDSAYEQQVRWLAIEALYHAVEISRRRGADEFTMEYAAKAIGHIEKLDPLADLTPQQDYLLGRLYFNVGLAYALTQNDHQRAVRAYERALPHLSQTIPVSAVPERGLHGERFVSMAVSYWQAGIEQEAVTLTQRGLELMQAAHQDGLLDDQALVAPLSNLAAMYKALGRSEDAQRMAARVARLQDRSPETNRR